MLRLTAIVYWLVLITWFAAIVAAAATATAAFGTLIAKVPELGVQVPQFAADPSGADAGRYLAGFIGQRVFDAIATLQMVLVPAMLLILGVQWSTRWPEQSAANALRVLCLLAACAATGYFLIFVAPGMNTALEDYRGAILAGDQASAATYKAAFDADHRISDPVLRTTGFLLLGAIVLSAATLTPRTVPTRR
jgi:hypothetical protein